MFGSRFVVSLRKNIWLLFCLHSMATSGLVLHRAMPVRFVPVWTLWPTSVLSFTGSSQVAQCGAVWFSWRSALPCWSCLRLRRLGEQPPTRSSCFWLERSTVVRTVCWVSVVSVSRNSLHSFATGRHWLRRPWVHPWPPPQLFTGPCRYLSPARTTRLMGQLLPMFPYLASKWNGRHIVTKAFFFTFLCTMFWQLVWCPQRLEKRTEEMLRQPLQDSWMVIRSFLAFENYWHLNVSWSVGRRHNGQPVVSGGKPSTSFSSPTKAVLATDLTYGREAARVFWCQCV